jgi:hypothetical protein
MVEIATKQHGDETTVRLRSAERLLTELRCQLIGRVGDDRINIVDRDPGVEKVGLDETVAGLDVTAPYFAKAPNAR